ncbi:MAG: acyl-CoA mutase large subunit family protein [Planctomycetota bacterium]|jgi:methylmalonyl-CoA mutase N-terminal domain/subunit
MASDGGDLRETSSGIPIPPVPRPAAPGPEYAEQLGDPGAFPFTRGIHPTMYRGRLWTMRQYAGFASAKESNARYRYLLERGQTGLSVAFDLPTQMGLDPDHERSIGEVGKAGVSIATLGDMETVFDQIPLDQVSTSMTINSTAPILLALYVAVAKRQGVDPAKLRGTVQNDLLKEYAARGTYVYPPGPSLRLATDLITWSVEHVPGWNPISVSGYHMREAGATAAQEVAFTLANGCAYLQRAADRGIDPAVIAKRVSFFFACHNNLFEEVAKFRAARRLWATLLQERFGITDPKAQRLRFHTQTGGSTLTAQAPDNNVVRVTLQALAAVLGGTQSLHTNGRDEALGLPTEASATLALRTQQIIAHESGVADAADPLGGSWLVEELTGALYDRATALLGEIDALGGAERAVERGFYQDAIAREAYTHQRAVETQAVKVVGVNCYTSDGDETLPIQQIDDTLHEARGRELAAWRAQRDGNACDAALGALGEAAAGDANLMPSILAAVEAGATLGEVSDAFRAAWGEHRA